MTRGTSKLPPSNMRLKSPSKANRSSALSEMFNLSDPTLDREISSPRTNHSGTNHRKVNNKSSSAKSPTRRVAHATAAMSEISGSKSPTSAAAASSQQLLNSGSPITPKLSTGKDNTRSQTLTTSPGEFLNGANFKYQTAMGDLRTSTALEQRAEEDCHPELFHRLWVPTSEVKGLDLEPLFGGDILFHVPHTVIFDLGQPNAWYFTSANRTFRRRRPKNCTRSEILRTFSGFKYTTTTRQHGRHVHKRNNNDGDLLCQSSLPKPTLGLTPTPPPSNQRTHNRTVGVRAPNTHPNDDSSTVNNQARNNHHNPHSPRRSTNGRRKERAKHPDNNSNNNNRKKLIRIVASFIQKQRNHTESPFSIQYFSKPELELFLAQDHKIPDGILQQYIPPRDDHAQILRSTWSPHHVSIESVVAHSQFDDPKLTMQQRAATMTQKPNRVSTFQHAPNSHIHTTLKRVCRTLITRVEQITNFNQGGQLFPPSLVVQGEQHREREYEAAMQTWNMTTPFKLPESSARLRDSQRSVAENPPVPNLMNLRQEVCCVKFARFNFQIDRQGRVNLLFASALSIVRVVPGVKPTVRLDIKVLTSPVPPRESMTLLASKKTISLKKPVFEKPTSSSTVSSKRQSTLARGGGRSNSSSRAEDLEQQVATQYMYNEYDDSNFRPEVPEALWEGVVNVGFVNEKGRGGIIGSNHTQLMSPRIGSPRLTPERLHTLLWRQLQNTGDSYTIHKALNIALVARNFNTSHLCSDVVGVGETVGVSDDNGLITPKESSTGHGKSKIVSVSRRVVQQDKHTDHEINLTKKADVEVMLSKRQLEKVLADVHVCLQPLQLTALFGLFDAGNEHVHSKESTTSRMNWAVFMNWLCDVHPRSIGPPRMIHNVNDIQSDVHTTNAFPSESVGVADTRHRSETSKIRSKGSKSNNQNVNSETDVLVRLVSELGTRATDSQSLRGHLAKTHYVSKTQNMERIRIISENQLHPVVAVTNGPIIVSKANKKRKEPIVTKAKPQHTDAVAVHKEERKKPNQSRSAQPPHNKGSRHHPKRDVRNATQIPRTRTAKSPYHTPPSSLVYFSAKKLLRRKYRVRQVVKQTGAAVCDKNDCRNVTARTKVANVSHLKHKNESAGVVNRGVAFCARRFVEAVLSKYRG